jgi:hypothetical protein
LCLSEGWELANARIPNLYAGQIHYLSARSRNGKPLEIHARTAASQPVKIEFSSRRANFDAPYLHWCKSRVQRLMAEGNESGAIELSVKSNLVCGLTAFVAWDESEKVPIARHELVQPNFESRFVGGFAYSRTDKARSAPGGLLGAGLTSLFETRFGAVEPTAEQLVTVLEQTSRRRLVDICQRAGVARWEALVKTIFKWIAEAPGEERLRRNRAIVELLDRIELQAAPLLRSGTPPDESKRNEAASQIRGMLVSFVEKLPKRKWPYWCAR